MENFHHEKMKTEFLPLAHNGSSTRLFWQLFVHKHSPLTQVAPIL